MLEDFKKFIMRGNVVDLAVGIIIGIAFGKIVTSFVNDIVMPPIGLLLGKVDFSTLFINISGKAYPTLAAAKAAGAPTINYGVFINTVFEFLIIAFVVFLLVRAVSRIMPKPATTKECEYCLSIVPAKATRCPDCTSELKVTVG